MNKVIDPVTYSLAYLHFVLFFIGVNITFFPMHFLGMLGMPRRVPSYPYAFEKWNYISSIGSSITMLSVLVFCAVLYRI